MGSASGKLLLLKNLPHNIPSEARGTEKQLVTVYYSVSTTAYTLDIWTLHLLFHEMPSTIYLTQHLSAQKSLRRPFHPLVVGFEQVGNCTSVPKDTCPDPLNKKVTKTKYFKSIWAHHTSELNVQISSFICRKASSCW